MDSSSTEACASIPLLPRHQANGAYLDPSRTVPTLLHFGDPEAEALAIQQTCGVFDLSARGRLCVAGTDRATFLHGQITNRVKGVPVGSGGYACLVNAKGKMHTDLWYHILEQEVLLDFEPGYSAAVLARLEQFVIADDVQILSAASAFGLLSFQGPQARGTAVEVARPPARDWRDFDIAPLDDPEFGRCYLAQTPRLGMPGFDWYVPVPHLEAAAQRIEKIRAKQAIRWCGESAWDLARVAAAIPRFGVDMNETTLPPEAGMESVAVSYNKGCYIGQEVIARIRTYGQTARLLRGLRFEPCPDSSKPQSGAVLLREGKEVGRVTSVAHSPRWGGTIGLGFVRKEWKEIGTILDWQGPTGGGRVSVATVTFQPFPIEHRD